MPNFIGLGKYFIFGTKFSWNEGTGICFNVECVFHGRNFDFLGGYLVVTARYLVIAAGYCSLPGGYCSLPLVTARSPFYYERVTATFLHLSADKDTVIKNIIQHCCIS